MDVSKSADERLRALVVLVKEILFQIDEVSVLMQNGHSASLSRALLQETAQILRELPDDLQQRYFEVLLALSQHAEINPRAHRAAEHAESEERYAELEATPRRRFNSEMRARLVASGGS